MTAQYWLMKSEPHECSIDDALAAPRAIVPWTGVRNYQARNFLRDQMKKGDRVLIYHSNADPPAVVGEAEIVREGYPDPTQFDRHDDHFDPDSAPGDPRWYQVDVKAVRKLPRPVSLPLIRETPALRKMALVQRGQRLSVQPVAEAEYATVVALGEAAK